MNQPAEHTGNLTESEPTSLKFIENHIEILAQRTTIGEEDFEELHRNIERLHLQESELRIVMLALAKRLKDREEEELISLSISLQRIARLEFPKPDAPLEESLHDIPERQERIRQSLQEVFSNSMCLNEPPEEDPEENGETTPATPNDLSQSWLFTEADQKEHESIHERAESLEPPQRQKQNDSRLVTIGKIQQGHELHEDDRVRWRDRIAITDIRRSRQSQIGTKALNIRNHVVNEDSDLHTQALDALEELQQLINTFLSWTYEELNANWPQKNEEEFCRKFFDDNQATLSTIFAIDHAIIQLEDDCREIDEMNLEIDFLAETIGDFSAELEKITNPEDSDYATLLNNGMHTQLRKFLLHRKEVLGRLERIQEDFAKIFHRFWKLEIKLPNRRI